MTAQAPYESLTPDEAAQRLRLIGNECRARCRSKGVDCGTCARSDEAIELAIAALAAREGRDACETCNGRGEIGGFVNMESGYQTDPCPECTPPPDAAPAVDDDDDLTVFAVPRAARRNDDPGEFGCGIEPNPKARYWQQRAAFWREQAIAHGYDPEPAEACCVGNAAPAVSDAVRVSALQVALMNAADAFAESAPKFPNPKDRRTLAQQVTLIREHAAALSASPAGQESSNG